MKTVHTLTFVPASLEATYRLSLHRRPIEQSAGLSWIAQVERCYTVSLPDDGNLAGLDCCVDLRMSEPFDGKENDESWEYAHGLLQWVGGSEPVLIRLHVPADTFATLMQLAERGHLPSLDILCLAGQGLENEGPYGPMKWDTTGRGLVPVKHIQFVYSFKQRAFAHPSDPLETP